ncbi:hypothetical protein OG693_37120 [Streptomyces sp. NBC_01259]|uniref:putative leader peptide n=1 Tax=unclassified Streptomyces TaxID=2593676 RepID=UPI003252A692
MRQPRPAPPRPAANPVTPDCRLLYSPLLYFRRYLLHSRHYVDLLRVAGALCRP